VRTLVILALLLGVSAPAAADPLPVGRPDLGRAWMRFERALRDHPPKPEVRIRMGDEFDTKTRAFFRGGFREVVRGIDALTAELRGGRPGKGPAAFALAFRLDVDPPVWVAGKTKEAEMKSGTVYDVPVADEDLARLRVRLLGPHGGTRMEMPFRAGRVEGRLSLAATGLSTGVYRFRIVGPGGIDEPAGRLPVLPEHPDVTRARNEKRIAGLGGDVPAQALASVRARNALITAKPVPGLSYAWITDPLTLATKVDAEIAALASGRNPYHGRKGDLWRIVLAKGEAVPFRIFVPESYRGKPVPLVIALHGAGADENALFEGYGAGLLKELAASKGFIVVTPRTMSVAGKPGAFPALLETIVADYAIDPARVYVLGHSLGGMATGLIARTHGDRIAACCQFAGGFGRTGKSGPPILFVHAGRDRIVRTGPPQASKLVTVRRYPDEGHTFVVAKALPAAIDWLLAHPEKKRE